MKNRFFTGLALFLLTLAGTGLFPSIAGAQEITARAGLDTSSILIGQQVMLKINVSLPKGKAITLPVFTDSLATGVEIVGQSRVDTLKTTDQQRLNLVQLLRITSFDTGFHKIPAIPIYESGKMDSLHILAFTNELFLTVNTIPVDTAQAIKDVKGVMSVPLSFWEIFRWVLLALVIILLVAGVWYYIRKRRKKLPVFVLPSRPAVPAHIQALEELEKLRVAKIWQAGKVKEYHTQLTDILRVYLERRFNVQAMEMTTDEILDALKTASSTAEAIAKMAEILQLADLVKFAKEQPLPLQHDNSLKLGIDFVNLTRPSVQENVSKEDSAPTNDHPSV